MQGKSVHDRRDGSAMSLYQVKERDRDGGSTAWPNRLPRAGAGEGLRGVRGDLEVLEVEPGDRGEGGGRDDTAEDRAARVVDLHQHDQARVRGGNHADEGGRVLG